MLISAIPPYRLYHNRPPVPTRCLAHESIVRAWHISPSEHERESAHQGVDRHLESTPSPQSSIRQNRPRSKYFRSSTFPRQLPRDSPQPSPLLPGPWLRRAIARRSRRSSPSGPPCCNDHCRRHGHPMLRSQKLHHLEGLSPIVEASGLLQEQPTPLVIVLIYIY